jgi:hypothetical protein
MGQAMRGFKKKNATPECQILREECLDAIPNRKSNRLWRDYLGGWFYLGQYCFHDAIS